MALPLAEYGASSTAQAEVVERLDLALDLGTDGELSARARLFLRPGSEGELVLVLNRALRVDRAVDEAGQTLAVRELGRVASEYFREARALGVTLGSATRELQLDYSGYGSDGADGRDWMGILLLADDERRMSVQTAFYPQVPLDLAGPAVRAWPTRLTLLAPPGFEVVAPGLACAPEPATDEGRAWCFESAEPTTLSLVAAPRVRQETLRGEARVVTLLTSEHAGLGTQLAETIEHILAFYSECWNAPGPRTVSVVEIRGRGDSYNWAASGLVAIDTAALGGGLPTDTLAHELAHLWWGDEQRASGRGERFLTESLAEYASWRFLAEVEGAAAAERAVSSAQERWWSAVHARGADPALFDVRFATPDYQALAYAKGPLALWRLGRALGEPRLDAALLKYRTALGNEGAEGAREFLAAWRDAFETDAAGAESAWLEQDGHAHLELVDVVFDGPRVRGAARAAPCPAGIAPPARLTLALVAHGEGSQVRRELVLGTEAEPFELSGRSELLALVLDPERVAPSVSSALVVRADAGFLGSEPADGARDVPLGRQTFRLRFGRPLAQPTQAFRARIEAACRSLALREKLYPLTITALTLADDGYTLALECEGTLPEREHVLVLPEEIATRAGVPLAPLVLRFRTRAATGIAPPRILTSEPADGAHGLATDLARVRVVFSEPMRIGIGFSGTLCRELEGQGWSFPPIADMRWEDERALVLELNALEPGRRYALPFGDRFMSRLGLRLARTDVHFETEP